MDDAPHAAGLAGADQLSWQTDVDFFKRGFVSVQDGDQIDDRVMVCEKWGERAAVELAHFEQIDHRQHLHMSGAGLTPRQNRRPDVLPRELFANMPADEAGATEDQNLFHGLNLAVFTVRTQHAELTCGPSFMPFAAQTQFTQAKTAPEIMVTEARQTARVDFRSQSAA